MSWAFFNPIYQFGSLRLLRTWRSEAYYHYMGLAVSLKVNGTFMHAITLFKSFALTINSSEGVIFLWPKSIIWQWTENSILQQDYTKHKVGFEPIPYPLFVRVILRFFAVFLSVTFWWFWLTTFLWWFTLWFPLPGNCHRQVSFSSPRRPCHRHLRRDPLQSQSPGEQFSESWSFLLS